MTRGGQSRVLVGQRGAARFIRLRGLIATSGSAKAGGLATAVLASNGIQLVFTIVFTRLLGASGYGSLASLMSAFLILIVVGQALQLAAARKVVLGELGGGPQVARALSRWTAELPAITVNALAGASLVRTAIAGVVGVPEHSWAAAVLAPSACVFVLLSLQRGLLQGLRIYAPVGASLVLETAGRFAFGLVLVVGGAGVTGAFLGTPLTVLLTSVALAFILRRRLPAGISSGVARHRGTVADRTPGLLEIARGSWLPLLALALLALLQNVDVIVVRHQLGGSRAGSYAAAVVAAKAVLWAAIGIGLYVLPEAADRRERGLDPRPVLIRALGVLGLLALPVLAAFALAPHPILGLAFGQSLTQASSALVLLGVAMAMLSATYLAVQYMLALGRKSFLWVLFPAAIAEPFLLSSGRFSLLSFAALVLGLQCVAAVTLLVAALAPRRSPLAAQT